MIFFNWNKLQYHRLNCIEIYPGIASRLQSRVSVVICRLNRDFVFGFATDDRWQATLRRDHIFQTRRATPLWLARMENVSEFLGVLFLGTRDLVSCQFRAAITVADVTSSRQYKRLLLMSYPFLRVIYDFQYFRYLTGLFLTRILLDFHKGYLIQERNNAKTID